MQEKVHINETLTERFIDTNDFFIPTGYSIEVIAQRLNLPISMVFDSNGDLLVAEAGTTMDSSRVIRMRNGQIDVLAEFVDKQITGINIIENVLYVSHRTSISTIMPDGSITEIIRGLPCNGDYGISKVVFGHIDRKIYFGMGTATNSGVVGLDNTWIEDFPTLHDYPGSYIMLNGQNFENYNVLTSADQIIQTGAFSPYGIPNLPYEIRKGVVKASGSILRADLNGANLELVNWGFRYIPGIKFDMDGRLCITNQGYSIRGSRPIANAEDEFHIVSPDIWYGWPDYVGTDPVTNSRFRPEGGRQPEFLLTNHPNLPPEPYAVFPANSGVMGFDINYNPVFGPVGDVYVAEIGNVWPRSPGDNTPYIGTGHRISKIDISTGGVSTFIINKSGFPYVLSGEGAFGRPVDVTFGPDGAMYILDYSISIRDIFNVFLPNTGVIWRVTRS